MSTRNHRLLIKGTDLWDKLRKHLNANRQIFESHLATEQFEQTTDRYESQRILGHIQGLSAAIDWMDELEERDERHANRRIFKQRNINGG